MRITLRMSARNNPALIYSRGPQPLLEFAALQLCVRLFGFCFVLGAGLLAAPISSSEPRLAVPTPQQWRVSEFTFTADKESSLPPLGVRLIAAFHGPSGATYRVPGFWDGGRTWKVRFTPDRPGKWTFETRALREPYTVVKTLFDSGIMRGGEPSRRVNVPLRGNKELYLRVGNAENGTAYDHADWADAHFVGKDGRSAWLDTLEPISARQGYKKLARRTNLQGRPLRIADREFKHGLGTHAVSEVVFRVPSDAVRFQAWVGVDSAVGKYGSVRFLVQQLQTPAIPSDRRVAGLDGQRGTFTAAPALGDNPLFRHGGILQVSANHRYLTYSDGMPFYWLGDTWWFCPSDLVPIDGSSKPGIPSMFKLLIATRRRQGFTVAHWAFLGHIKGKTAFAEFRRTRTVDPDFWHTVDRYVAVSNTAGVVPVIGMGWCGWPLDLEEWRVVWQYVVARYGACGVTWLICGEYNMQAVPDRKIAETMKLGAFIKSIDPWERAMTIHPWAFRGDRRQAWKEAWYDFIMFQGGHGNAPSVETYYEAWREKPTRPVLEGECAYEGIHTFTAADVRNRAWRAFMAGCVGYTYGSHGLWYPTQNEHDMHAKKWGKPTPWWIALERPGADHMGCMRTILERVAWWRLEPQPDALSLTGTDTVHKIADFTAQLDAAKSTRALWCKRIAHSWALADLPDIELHPKGGAPATLTWPAIALPKVGDGEALRLVLALGMNPKANLNDPKHPSDGVTYAVVVNGKSLLREHRKSKQWEYHCFDLTEFAGRRVTLTLATEAGENTNWDHARFRAPVIVRTNAANSEPLRDAYTATLLEPVLVKADGQDVFVIYFPSVKNGRRPTFFLRGLAPGKTYAASWQDPRTGAAQPLAPIRAADSPAPLPSPPDAQDWVLLLQPERQGARRAAMTRQPRALKSEAFDSQTQFTNTERMRAPPPSVACLENGNRNEFWHHSVEAKWKSNSTRAWPEPLKFRRGNL